MHGLNKISSMAGMVLLFLVYPTNGSAVEFAKSVTYPAGTNPQNVIVADFNGDGQIDLVVLNGGSRSVSILLGNGDGTFQAARNFDVGGDSPTSIVVADFNSDGKLDLAVAIPGNIPAPPTTFPTCTQSSVNLMLGNGDGTFQAPHQTVTVDSAVLSLTGADLNGDGKTDLIARRYQNDPACALPGENIFLSVGDGSFLALPSPVPVDSPPDSPIVVEDFNGDGKLDLVTSGSILLGYGDGTFQAPLALPLPSGCGVFCIQRFPAFTTGDFNRDGRLDIALERGRRKCIDNCWNTPFSFDTMIMLGNGDGTFGSPLTFDPGGFFLMTGDFNGDGKLDIAVAPTVLLGSPLIHILLGKGDGTFPTTFDYDLGSGPIFLVAADLNNDKLPDVVAADYTEAAISVVLNTSDNSGADLGLTLGTIPATVTVGAGDLNYLATVYSGGPQDASGVVLTENLPTAFKFVSAKSSQGKCSGTTTIICDIGAMTEFSTATVQFIVTPTAPGTLTADLKVTGTQPDPNSNNNSASFTVTAVVPDFMLSPTATSLTVKRGGQTSETLTIGAQGGFSERIVLACSVRGSAPMPTCGISPNSVTPGNSATLTVNASALTAELTSPLPLELAGRLFAAWLPLGLMGCVFSTGFDKKRRRMWLLCLLVMVATILSAAACGGGGPRPQMYNVTVTGVSGSTQHSTTVTLTVQ